MRKDKNLVYYNSYFEPGWKYWVKLICLKWEGFRNSIPSFLEGNQLSVFVNNLSIVFWG